MPPVDAHPSPSKPQYAIDAALLQAIREVVKAEVAAEMKPFNDAMGSWKHIKAQIMFWGTAVLAFGGAIQAVQAIGGVVGHYVSLK